MKTYYDVLGISPNASVTDAIKAYRELIKIWHSDSYNNWLLSDMALSESEKEILNANAKAIRERIQAAYEYLSDPVKHRQYQLQYKSIELIPASSDELYLFGEWEKLKTKHKAYVQRETDPHAKAAYLVSQISIVINQRDKATHDIDGLRKKLAEQGQQFERELVLVKQERNSFLQQVDQQDKTIANLAQENKKLQQAIDDLKKQLKQQAQQTETYTAEIQRFNSIMHQIQSLVHVGSVEPKPVQSTSSVAESLPQSKGLPSYSSSSSSYKIKSQGLVRIDIACSAARRFDELIFVFQDEAQADAFSRTVNSLEPSFSFSKKLGKNEKVIVEFGYNSKLYLQYLLLEKQDSKIIIFEELQKLVDMSGIPVKFWDQSSGLELSNEKVPQIYRSSSIGSSSVQETLLQVKEATSSSSGSAFFPANSKIKPEGLLCIRKLYDEGQEFHGIRLVFVTAAQAKNFFNKHLQTENIKFSQYSLNDYQLEVDLKPQSPLDYYFNTKTAENMGPSILTELEKLIDISDIPMKFSDNYGYLWNEQDLPKQYRSNSSSKSFKKDK